jgi:hypothetical protein
MSARNKLIQALRNYEQADEAGVMVLVSRQACDEAAELLDQVVDVADYPDGISHGISMGELIESRDAEIDALTDKAIRFDLDQAGIERREAEAVELVELRSNNAELKARVEGLKRLLGMIGGVCDNVHHEKWQQHTSAQRCPIEIEIEEALR